MIKCRNCGKEIAEDARTCPHCGTRMPTAYRMIWRYVWGAIGLIIVIRYILWPMIH